MTKIMAVMMVGLLAGAALGAEPEMPKLPEPQQEHEWLMQLVGEWDAEVEMFKEPGQPPEKSQGTESVRAIGGFWTLGENKGVHMDKPFTGILVLGYDLSKTQYVGLWFDSMTSHLWTYNGTLDASGKILTLKGEGPCPGTPEKVFKFKEKIEIKDKDHRVFTSSMQGEDGKWVHMMTINYRRRN